MEINEIVIKKLIEQISNLQERIEVLEELLAV